MRVTDIVLCCKEANWYKPKLGEPYRPLLAMPPQITDLDPAFARCTDGFFTAYDPPRALTPASAMAPATTTGNPVKPQETAAPRSIQDAGPAETKAPRPGDILQPISKPAPAPAQDATPPELSASPKPEFQQPTANAHHDSTSMQAPVLEPLEEPDGDTELRKFDSEPAPTIDAATLKSENNPEGSAIIYNGQRTRLAASNIPINQPTGAETGQPETRTRPNMDNPRPVNEVLPNGSRQSQPWNPSDLSDGQMSQLADALGPSSQTPAKTQKAKSFPNPNPAHPVPSSEVNPASQDLDSLSQAQPVFRDGEQGSDSPLSVAATPQTTDNEPPAQVSIPTTTIAGHNIQVLPNGKGVSIGGNTIVPGSPPVIVSGTPVSVNEASHIHFGDEIYYLPTIAPAPAMTLPNGALATPITNGVLIHGLLMTAGASATTILGAPVFLDTSDRLVFSTETFTPPATTPASASNPTIHSDLDPASGGSGAMTGTTSVSQASNDEVLSGLKITDLDTAIKSVESTLSRGIKTTSSILTQERLTLDSAARATPTIKPPKDNSITLCRVPWTLLALPTTMVTVILI